QARRRATHPRSGSRSCAGRAQGSPGARASSEAGALPGLGPGHAVGRSFGVALLRRRSVPGAVEAAVDRVGLQLVAVGINERVVVEIDGPVDGVPEEAL